MTSKGIFAVSLKLMGVYSLIQSISLLQPFGMFISGYSKLIEGEINLPLMYFASLLPSLMLMIIAFVLLFWGDRIANKFSPSDQTNDSVSNLSTKDVQALAFSVVGVVIFLLAFIQLVRSGSSILFFFQRTKDSSQLFNLPYTVGIILQLIFGIALFFGAKPLSFFWHRIKYESNSRRNET